MTVTGKQKRLLKQFAKKLKLKLIVLYGSKVSGLTHQESDLDIAVLAVDCPDYSFFKKTYAALSGIFKGENVDVRFLNDADPLFLMQVVTGGHLLAGSRRDYDELKMLANRRYIDDGRKYFSYQNALLKTQQQYLKQQLQQ